MLKNAVDYLLNEVLTTAAEYENAEKALSMAYNKDKTPAAWEAAARDAKRRAAQLAITLDGLADRSFSELGISKNAVRKKVSKLCSWPTTGGDRNGAYNRVRAVANAYKHSTLSDPTLPITSENDILVVGLGYGRDGYGVGKPGFPEVIVKETNGAEYKFLGDALVSIAEWFRFLQTNGAYIPRGPFRA